jgi:CubicO group peptidase (beta-lactamase class C family)
VTADTIFDTGDISKSFTAAAVALLVDEDKFRQDEVTDETCIYEEPRVHWTTPVAELLPGDFVLAKSEHTKQVTIEDILSHQSGMPRYEHLVCLLILADQYGRVAMIGPT